MAGDGELRAFFRAAQEDAAQAVENAAKAISDHIDKTAQNVIDSVNAVEQADRASADLFRGIGSDIAGEEPAGGVLKWTRNYTINRSIDRTLERVNPKFNPRESAYSENCTGVVQANELTRRGIPSQAGPLEKYLRKDEGGHGGRQLSSITGPWGGRFTPGTKTDIEDAFKEPGSRGVVYIEWNHPTGLPISNGAHVFNVENVGGKVRFLDGQPTPPVTDASHYFDDGHDTMYIRLDNRPTPSPDATKPYLEP
jgi:hypothetical protein